MTRRWSRLDRRVRSVAAEGVHFGLMTERWVAQRPDAGRVRPVSADVGCTEETLCDQTLAMSGQA